MIYAPMLATIGTIDDLKRTDYIFEPKLDGYRALCLVNKKMKFLSRNHIDLTDEFPEFDFRKQIKAKSCLLDGEIIIYDEQGNPNFNLLQRRHQLRMVDQQHQATYVVFDILMFNNVKVTSKTLLERKQLLEKIIVEGNNLELMLFTINGSLLWKEIKKHNLEGVMAKDIASLYYPGKRVKSWLKIKQRNSIDCVIVGYTQERRDISSLALAIYRRKKLYYIGKVGTGFNEKNIRELYKKIAPIKISAPPIVNNVNIPAHIIWVKPKFVAEIEYVEITRDKRLRSPVFIRLRDDKDPEDCTR